MISRIEVEFAAPVELTEDERHQLHALITAVVRRHQPACRVHWLSGYGSKPVLRCRADQALLGKPIDPSLPVGPVEPTFDDSVLYFETCIGPPR